MSRILLLGVTAGQDVLALQHALNLLASSGARTSRHEPLATDGRFGSTTQRRLKEFQAADGLAADGMVTPLTWDRIRVLLRAIPGLLVTLAPGGPDTAGGTGPGPGDAPLPVWMRHTRFEHVLNELVLNYTMFDGPVGGIGATNATINKEHTRPTFGRSPGGGSGSGSATGKGGGTGKGGKGT